MLRRSASHYMLNNDRNGLYEMMINMADQPGMVRVRIMNSGRRDQLFDRALRSRQHGG